MAGENINFDQFPPDIGPDTTSTMTHARSIAADPYLHALLLNFYISFIHSIMETVTVYMRQRQFSKSVLQMEILWRVASYFKTVESQGRGALHLP